MIGWLVCGAVIVWFWLLRPFVSRCRYWVWRRMAVWVWGLVVLGLGGGLMHRSSADGRGAMGDGMYVRYHGRWVPVAR